MSSEEGTYQFLVFELRRRATSGAPAAEKGGNALSTALRWWGVYVEIRLGLARLNGRGGRSVVGFADCALTFPFACLALSVGVSRRVVR